MRNKIVVGNWKMNGFCADLSKIGMLCEMLEDARADVVVCPPALLIGEAANACRGSRLCVGGQDCHSDVSGAHTGDISADMLKDIGASHVILGHSERREEHGETDVLVQAKIEAAQNAGLVPILCIGETHAQKAADKTHDVLRQQLALAVPKASTGANFIIAYEPIWAIGTGNSASGQDVQDLLGFIRGELEDLVAGDGSNNIRILYGGSVNAKNVMDYVQSDVVDGFLVGGASLDVTELSSIVASFEVT